MPRDVSGVIVLRHFSVFGFDDVFYGYGEVFFEDVIVFVDSILFGEGRGFEIV